MKATRYEYMTAISNFLETQDYPKESILEISGDTKLCHKYFNTVTTTEFPHIDAHNLPYDNNSFDCILLNQVLEHVKKPWQVVKEVHRVCKPRGIAIIASPFFYQIHAWPEDYWRFTPEALEILCEDFSEILLSHRAGNGEMIKHMVDNPEDRSSGTFMRLATIKSKKDAYFTNSTVIARK